MDMLMTLGAPIGCFVAFFLSLICVTEIVVMPWLRNRRLRHDAQAFLNPPVGKYLPRRYPASGEGI